MATRQESKSPSPHAAAICWISFAIGLACLVFTACYIPLSRRHFAAIFTEFDMELPRPTQFMLAIPGIVFPVVGFLCAAGMITVQFVVPEKKLAAVFHIFFISLCCVALVVYHLLFTQPLLLLIENLSK